MNDVERRRTHEIAESLVDLFDTRGLPALAERVREEFLAFVDVPGRVEVIRSDETDDVRVEGWAHLVLADRDDIADEIASGRPVDHVVEDRTDPHARDRMDPRGALLSILNEADRILPRRACEKARYVVERLRPLPRVLVHREGGVVQGVVADHGVTLADGDTHPPTSPPDVVDEAFAAVERDIRGLATPTPGP